MLRGHACTLQIRCTAALAASSTDQKKEAENRAGKGKSKGPCSRGLGQELTFCLVKSLQAFRDKVA